MFVGFLSPTSSISVGIPLCLLVYNPQLVRYITNKNQSEMGDIFFTTVTDPRCFPYHFGWFCERNICKKRWKFSSFYKLLMIYDDLFPEKPLETCYFCTFLFEVVQNLGRYSFTLVLYPLLSTKHKSPVND